MFKISDSEIKLKIFNQLITNIHFAVFTEFSGHFIREKIDDLVITFPIDENILHLHIN